MPDPNEKEFNPSDFLSKEQQDAVALLRQVVTDKAARIDALKEALPRPHQPLTLDNLFVYHPPKGNQVERYHLIRTTGKLLAETIQNNTPVGAEQTLAIRAVQQAVMWANAGIACNE